MGKKRRDGYLDAYNASSDLFEPESAEVPPPAEPAPVALRGRRLPCPHCGELRYFGAGALPGIVRSEDFSVTGVSACCGKPIVIRCGATTNVVAG